MTTTAALQQSWTSHRFGFGIRTKNQPNVARGNKAIERQASGTNNKASVLLFKIETRGKNWHLELRLIKFWDGQFQTQSCQNPCGEQGKRKTQKEKRSGQQSVLGFAFWCGFGHISNPCPVRLMPNNSLRCFALLLISNFSPCMCAQDLQLGSHNSQPVFKHLEMDNLSLFVFRHSQKVNFSMGQPTNWCTISL